MNKFKKWLITKLGGYTEFPTTQPLVIAREDIRHIDTIRASYVACLDEPETYVRQQLSRILADQIYKEISLYSYEEQGKIVYRAELQVVRKGDEGK